ncbi:hypothetical protein QCA50_009110 [Cerrena zonata]|uniref:Cryptic loci regulator 2 N-terminal domain-containing protein n=1 Tax=Cerrena zonata TaxID=2478898 RepID=A0AAW0G3M9_9APHY
MSVRRLGKHTLPENPTWLEFTTTDGDKAQWSRNTTKVVDGDGQVNYMRPVTIDEDPAVHWRIVVGALAKALGKPDGPAYVLKTWPKGHAMYDRNKGKESNPRHDMYLYGSIHIGKFRSANEFVPHATWLFTDPTLTRSDCACKYCAKMPQKVISQSFGIIDSYWRVKRQ